MSERNSACIFEIEFPFQLAKHFVVDLILGPELDERGALDGAQIPGDCPVFPVVASDYALGIRSGLLQQVEPLLIMVREVFHDPVVAGLLMIAHPVQAAKRR